MILTDSHVHSRHSFDGHDEPAALCEAALAAGLSYVCITDHFDSDGQFQDPEGRMREIAALKERYAGQLRVGHGVEIGEIALVGTAADQLLDSFDFDCVLGSCHVLATGENFAFLPDADFAEKRGWVERYFAELLDLIAWGRFHVLSHITYPLRYMTQDGSVTLDDFPLLELSEPVFQAIIDRNLSLELNMSGLRRNSFPMPHEPLLRRYREMGGQLVTLGSDAHTVDAVGQGMAQGAALLRAAGFTHHSIYVNGQAQHHKL